MKYQQLENLESGWKWISGEEASRRGVNHPLHRSQCRQEAVDVLLSLENEPVLVNGWIDKAYES